MFLCSMVSSPLNCEDRLIRVTGGKVGKELLEVRWERKVRWERNVLV